MRVAKEQRGAHNEGKMPTVDVDMGLNRASVLLVEDRQMGMVEMEGWMFQESRGTDSDGWEPMASEERVAQGD